MNTSPFLFDISTLQTIEASKQFSTIDYPLLTKNKAKFIARYLKEFTYVTKHGTYIDAFAGPQHEDSRDETWAAKLVMENEPKWLRNFYLFDFEKQQIEYLNKLKYDYFLKIKDRVKRQVTITSGDCNKTLPALLRANPIREKEASFCLLDQRSTECNWETVKTIAAYKGSKGGNKIELFYFLSQGWIDRAIKSWRKDVESRCRIWFGNDHVFDFLKMHSHERGRFMAQRFKDDFGYKYAYPFPIQKEGEQGRIMFWMIHATDHDRAPDLMHRAYKHIGAGGGIDDPIEQLELFH